MSSKRSTPRSDSDGARVQATAGGFLRGVVRKGQILDDVALNAVGLEHAMNPETIEPGFLDRYNLDRRCDAVLGSALQPRKKVEQFARVTADERVLGHLPAAERQ